jgi:hypothetical protein
MQEKGQGLELKSSGASLKQVATVLGLVFAVALAIVVGKRMSAEAMAVVIGVICGVAASIPTLALLMIVLTRRERQRTDEAERQARAGSQPPVVVIQGGAPQALPQGPQAGYWPAPAQEPPVDRQFHIVGGDDLLLDDTESMWG